MVASQVIDYLSNNGTDVGSFNDISKKVSITDVSEVDTELEIIYSLRMDIRGLTLQDISYTFNKITILFEEPITFLELLLESFVYPLKKHCRCYFTGNSQVSTRLQLDGRILYFYEVMVRYSKHGN